MHQLVYRYPCKNSLMQLRQGDEGRWSLSLNGREVCSYSSASKAAEFVARGKTGEPAIDCMASRPTTLSDWEQVTQAVPIARWLGATRTRVADPVLH